MSLEDVSLPKKYDDGEALFEEMLNAWRQTTEAAFATMNLNFTQLRKDCFLSNYDYDNDGNANLGTNLYQLITNVVTGATPITGTTADTFTINTDGNSSTLTTASLTSDRTHTLPDVSGTFALVGGGGATLDNLIPIGSFLHFSDFNATLAMPNSTIWHCCDGQAIADASSPLNGITPLDMTGRYLVGFTTGVEGDGSIDLAGNTNAAAVGQTAHQIDLSGIAHTHGALGTTASGGQSADHTHTGAAHTHTGPSHTHTGPSHSHSYGTLKFKTIATAGTYWYAYDSGGNLINISGGEAGDGGGNRCLSMGLGSATYYTTDGSGSTGSDGTSATGAGGTGATSSDGAGATGGTSAGHTHDINHTHASAGGGSATQTIQPRSVQCRIYVRKR